jgi:hypothetical protein
MRFGSGVILGWALLILGELTDWRWCFHAAFILLAVILLAEAWRIGQRRPR